MSKSNPIFEPISLETIGSDKDPCFGKGYDLTTSECKQCGDSEVCCIKFASLNGVTRKQLEESTKYKDLEVLLDKKAFKKSIRALKRKGLEKKEILDRLSAKYSLSLEETKIFYKQLKKDKNDK